MKKQYDFRHGRRGAVVRAPSGKTRITIRIDDDILQWFREQVHKAGGGNYQTLINDALRDRKSTRLNSSHGYISYAVFCLKKKNTTTPSLFTPTPSPTAHTSLI